MGYDTHQNHQGPVKWSFISDIRSWLARPGTKFERKFAKTYDRKPTYYSSTTNSILVPDVNWEIGTASNNRVAFDCARQGQMSLVCI